MLTTIRFIIVTVLALAVAVAAQLLLPSIPAAQTEAGGSLAPIAAVTGDAPVPRIQRVAGGDDGINPQPLPPGRRS